MKISKFVQHAQPLETGAVAVYNYDPDIEENLRFSNRFGDDVLLHEVSPDGKYIYVPRELCQIGEIDSRVLGDPAVFPSKPTPRPNQTSIFAKTLAHLVNGNSGIVKAYTGWGKTVLGYAAAHAVQVKTLVITTKDDIFKQWVEGAPKFLGVSPDRVGVIRGTKCEIIDTDFVVAMIQSLSREGKYPDWITQGFGLVIFDECHRLPAEQFARVASMFPAKVRLGLTAHLARADQKEVLAEAHIGSLIAATKAEESIPKIIPIETGWRCPRVYRVDKKTGEKVLVRIPHEIGKTAHIEKILASDPARNTLICEAIENVFQAKRKVVVFSTMTFHLEALMHELTKKFKISGHSIGHYHPATTKAEIEARARVVEKAIIMSCYGMMGEGTNIPALDTCILAMPRANVIQPVGRIRRELEGKTFPVVIDFIDKDSEVFMAYASSRNRWYRSIGCHIVVGQE